MDLIDIHCINIWDFQRIKILFKNGEEKSEGRETWAHKGLEVSIVPNMST